MSQDKNINQLYDNDPSKIDLSAISLENFKLAVHLLYKSTNPEIKRKGDQYLFQFEKSNEAWDISIAVLNSPDLEEEAYFNASQIIKKKLRFDFGNYCENQTIIENLATFFIDKIIQFKNHQYYLISNLCGCFALFTIFSHQMLPDIIKVVVNKLNNQDIRDLNSLLLIFSYLAENANDSDIVIDENYRISNDKLLNSISNDVIVFIDYLIKIMASSKENLIKTNPLMSSFFRLMNKDVIDCFKNWIEFGFSSHSLTKLTSDYSTVLEFIFQIDPENMETYSECICLLLRLPLQDDQMQGLTIAILNKVIAFKDRVYQAVKIKDEDEIKFFIDIFQHLCENNFEIIHNENRVDILRIMVELSIHTPEQRIGNICDFWQRFILFLTEKQVATTEIAEKYEGILKEVVVGLIKLLKFDNSVFLELNKNKTKQFKHNEEYRTTVEYRKTLKLFFQDFSFYYGFNYFYLNLILPQITYTISLIKADMNDISAWSILESLVYCFMCISKNIDKHGDLSFLDTLLDTLFEIPENIVQIKRTVTDAIDEISGLLSKRPNLLVKAFNYLVVGLENPLTISIIFVFNPLEYCSISLKNILSDNKTIFYQNKPDLLKIYKDKIKDKAIDSPVYRKILEGIVEVVMIADDQAELKQNLVDILTPWIGYLVEAKNKSEISDLSSQDIELLIEIIDIIKTVSRSAYDTMSTKNYTIMTQIFGELWPLVKHFLKKFPNSNDLVEELTQLIKHYMRGMISDFKQFLEEYLTIMLDGYKTIPISSYLYAFEIIVTVFVNDVSVLNMLQKSFKELCVQTFTNYLTSMEDFENETQLSEDFFGLLFRLIRLNPFLIFDSELFDNLIYVCINNIGISHPETNKNIIYFLDKIITFQEIKRMKDLDNETLEKYYTKVKNNIKSFGENLVNKIVEYILSVPASMLFDHLKDLIKSLVRAFPEESALWFSKSLKSLPNDCLTNTEKDKFVKNILNFDDRTMEDTLDNFYRRCLSRLHRMTN